jgi:(hydroxyamino)benzene mutase
MLAGLLLGLAIAPAPYPRLMLTAHIQFLVNGMMSVFAGLLLRASLSVVGQASGRLILIGHVSTWAVCLSEVAGAIWGTSKALPIAAGQAGAAGGASWQETVVLLCHIIPGLALIIAWTLLVLGIWRSSRRQSAPAAG